MIVLVVNIFDYTKKKIKIVSSCKKCFYDYTTLTQSSLSLCIVLCTELTIVTAISEKQTGFAVLRKEVKMRLFILFYLLLILQKSESIDDVVTVQEVVAGHLAELPCLSSDDQHRFMFWQFGNNDVIGPGNPLNEKKYNYEVLTGKLLIRGVSTTESGFYKCVSRGLSDDPGFKIHSVELVVKKDWEDVWETDFETNLLRGLAAVMVIVVAIAIILLIITIKKKRNHNFFDLEESREGSPARYNPNTPDVASGVEDGGIDNATLDIDFPKVFKQMQKEQAMP